MLEFISWVFVLGLQCEIESVSLSRVCDCSEDLQCLGCEVLDCAALPLATSSRASGSANLLLVSQRPRAAAHLTGISRVGEIASPVERASLPAAAARQLNCFVLAQHLTALLTYCSNGPRWLLTMFIVSPSLRSLKLQKGLSLSSRRQRPRCGDSKSLSGLHPEGPILSKSVIEIDRLIKDKLSPCLGR